MGDAILNGSLSAFRLPEVLTFLSTTRKDGTLTLNAGEKEAYLHFSGGALVYAGSNQDGFRLGALLQRRKKITASQRERIDARLQRDGGRFGDFAVRDGVLTEAQLRDFLKVQVSEIVYDCFVWEGGTFAFREETVLPAHAVTISIDLANLIMEGARRIEEWEQCLRLLPDKSVVFRVVATPKDEKVTLTAEEWRLLFLINGVRTLEELCQVADDDPFHVYRIVYGLYSNRLIELVAPAERPDDTNSPPRKVTTTTVAAAADSTMRQSSPSFGGDSTMRDADDDTSLLVSSEAHLSYSDVVRPTVAQLTIANGDTQGKVIALTEPEYSIGRLRDNAIQILDLGVSGLHARLFRGSEGYVLEDLQSRNGTWVNGNRIVSAVLQNGDRVHVGQTDLLYEVLL